MKSKKKKNYIILADEKDDLLDFLNYLERIVPQKFPKNNLVIDLLKYNTLELPQLLSFLKLSNYQRSTKLSFVIVNDAIEIDEIPIELVVVPTLQEAEDIIEMEEIERDLGF